MRPTALSFTDTTERTWYRGAVKYLSDEGLTKGIISTTFAPAAALTPAMLVTAIYRLDGDRNPHVSTLSPM